MSENNGASALHMLHRAGQVADELFASKVGGSEITPRQHLVLTTVAECKAPSQTTLVAKTGIDRSTLADIVKRLVERGMLQRRRTRHDARMYAVGLTEKGQLALNKSAPAATSTDALIKSAVGEKDWAVFLRSLEAIVKSVEEQQRAAA